MRMPNVVVTESALRDVLREALWNKDYAGWSSNEAGPATVNSNVDPSIAVTDPVNPRFKPQDKTEFSVALGQLVRNMPDTDMPGLYDDIKSAIDDRAEKKDKANMDTKAAQGGTKQVEEAVRQVVRDVVGASNARRARVSEAPEGQAPPERKPLPRRLKKGEQPGPVVNLHDLPPVKKIPAGIHGGEYMRRIEKNKQDLHKTMPKAVADLERPVVDDDEGALGPEAEPAKKRAYKSTAIGGMSDVQGATFEDIAKELDFSVAGAKQAVDKALDKAKWIAKFVDPADPDALDVEDLDIIVMSAMNDYIKYLAKSGDVSSEDVRLMKDHPDIVTELDGFREYLHNHLRRARKGGKLYDPLDDSGDDAPAPEPVASLTPASDAPTAPKPAVGRAAAKGSYKIYPGGSRYGGKPVVTRYKGQVFGPSGETQFKPNEQGEVSLDGDKLSVKKPGSDHSQTWEPVGESKRPVLYLRPVRR